MSKKASKTEGIRPQFTPNKVLENWRVLCKSIPKMNLEELKAALEMERKKSTDSQRKDIVMRLERRLKKVLTEKLLMENMP
jgi:hypothetical protein